MFIRRNEKGFTLVELMIVVVIIGILASIAIPKFSALISKTKLTEAKSLLRQIVNLQTTYYQINSEYVAFVAGADELTIGFEQPDVNTRRFEYSFATDATFTPANSIATALEGEDVNGDGDQVDTMTLAMDGTEAATGGLAW